MTHVKHQLQKKLMLIDLSVIRQILLTSNAEGLPIGLQYNRVKLFKKNLEC